MSSHKKFSYTALKKIAEKFLQDQHESLSLPIPIDEIVELNLKIKLTALKGLKKNFDVDAFIDSDCDEISIDNDCFLRYPQRSRFTLAHELGHKILHEEIYSENEITKPEQFLEFQAKVGDDEYGWLEYQANVFAACLLVPSVRLKEEVGKAIREKEKINKEAEFIVPYLEKLPDIFEVSYSVIRQRIIKENLI